MVVFWGGFDAGYVQGDKVAFVAGDQLVDRLQARPGAMVPETIRRVEDGIRTARPCVRGWWWARWRTGAGHPHETVATVARGGAECGSPAR
jgi:hypothetical protein